MGPRSRLEGRKISSPPGFDPGLSSPQLVAIPTEYPTHIYIYIYTHKHTRARAHTHTYVCMSLTLVLSPVLDLMCRVNFCDLENLYFFPVCEIFLKLRKFLNRGVTSTKKKVFLTDPITYC